MFSWTRLEIGLAALLAAAVVIGGAGQWLFVPKDGRPIVVEARQTGERLRELESGETAPSGSPDGSEPQVDLAAGEARGEPSAGGKSGTPPGKSSPGEAAETAAEGTEGGEVDVRININTAPPSELQRLPGIGPALALRIVEYRETWGPFEAIEDIMEVSGIGPVTFANMKHLIKVR